MKITFGNPTMKIAYIVNHDLSQPSGVTKKVMMQADYWESNGHQVKILCTNSSKVILGTDRLTFYKNFGRIIINNDIMNDLELFNPDVVYYRYSIFGRTLYKIINKYNCIGEANTFEVKEFWGLLKKYRTLNYLVLWLANKLLRPLIIANSKGLITVTHEMARYSENSRFNKEVHCVPNGINVKDYIPLKQVDSALAEPVRLFFMGSPDQPWHGVDLIESMAAELTEFEFHIVGMKGIETNNVHFHGYLTSDKYCELLEKCHICIGSLALFRNGMDEGSALKVREYVALGYPVIVGHDDASIIDSNTSYPWFKKIDFQQGDIGKISYDIKEFCRVFRSYVVPKEDKFYFSVEHTEEKRLSLFKSIAKVK